LSVPSSFKLPDALVLGVGGVVGEAWMSGVLAGIEEAAGVDFRECEYLVGTSAGSIVATRLAAGRRPRRPHQAEPPMAPPDDLPDPGASGTLGRAAVRWSAALGGAVARRAAPIAVPTRALSRAALLALLPRGEEELRDLRRRIDRLGVHFDGRLRIAAVARRTGRRVTFGAPGAPRASVAEAVVASCSIPGRFTPLEIGGREYVDGGAWSPTNIDVAPVGADARVLCLNSTGALARSTLSPAAPLVAMSRTAARVEAMFLRSRGVKVEVVAPDRSAVEAMGVDRMDPVHSEDALAAGFAQGLAR
jgi:NTE family protein